MSDDQNEPGYPWQPGSATGIGSMPGTNPAEAMRVVAGELPDFPHLPELPDRGPGADLTGRTAALLIEIPVEVTPRGWRLAERPGRDLVRARTMLSSDLDVMEEVLDGFRGPLKIQLCGPWTLAATLELPRTLNVAIADPGAVAELTASLAEGAAAHVAEIAKRVPGRPPRRPVRRASPARRGRRRGADGERAVATAPRRGRDATRAAGPGDRRHREVHRGAQLRSTQSRSASSGRRGPVPCPSTSASYGEGKGTRWPRPRRRAWGC